MARTLRVLALVSCGLGSPLAVQAQEVAAEGKGTATWGLAYVLVILAVALGIFGVLRPGSRTEDFRRSE